MVEEELVDAIMDTWNPDASGDPSRIFTVSLGDVPTDLLLAAKEHMDNLGREFALASTGASTGESAAMPADMVAMVETVLNRFAGPRQAIKVQALAAAARGEDRTTLTLRLRCPRPGRGGVPSRTRPGRRLRPQRQDPHPRDPSTASGVPALVCRVHHRAAAPCRSGHEPRMQETFEQHLLRALDQVSAAQTQAEALASRLAHLQQLTAELTGVSETEDIAETVVGHAADAFGVRFASLYGLEEDELVLIRSRGNRSEPATRWSRVGLDAELPICEAARKNQAVIVRGASELVRRYPALGDGDSIEEVSVACMPLSIDDRCIGVMALSFPLYRDLTDRDEIAFLSSLADACAQALDRARALADARETADKLAFLADASVEFASSLDARTTLMNLAHLLVPRLGDWCSVQTVDGDTLETVAIAHVDPDKVAFAEEWQSYYPPDLADDTAVARVIRTGKPELYPSSATKCWSRAPAAPNSSTSPDSSSSVAAWWVPISTADGVLGTITLLYAESGRRYDDDDLLLATELAARAGIAVERARQYDLQSGQLARITRIAETAQHAILAPVPAR
jgi:GAF domain-containing protein